MLGRYPTGVCVIAATTEAGNAVGMTVGSFTSVSLDPPLVAFLAAETSTTWPQIQQVGRFSVNVLAAGQEPICRAFSRTGGDKFAGVDWHPSAGGQPIINGASAWLDCIVEDVHRAGDHFIVTGQVTELDIGSPLLPLLFFQGGYGRFTTESLVTADRGLVQQLRRVDLLRSEMEVLAATVGVECITATRVGDEIVIVACAKRPDATTTPSYVGSRYPFMAPVGAVFAAWADEDVFARWVRRDRGLMTEDDEAAHRASLREVVLRGYALGVERAGAATGSRLEEAFTLTGLVSEDELPTVLQQIGAELNPVSLRDEAFQLSGLTAPVFGPGGTVAFGLSLNGFQGLVTLSQVSEYAGHLTAAARRMSAALSMHALGSGDG